MKKKLTAVALIVCMLAIMLVGASLAYFTDTDDATNTFTMGNIDITLDEAAVERVGDEWVKNNDRVHENTYENIYPGAVLPKDPTVHNVGSYGAFVRAKITVDFNKLAGMQADKELFNGETEDEDLKTILDIDSDKWTYVKYAVDFAARTVTYTYNYNDELAAGADTSAIFTEVSIPGALTNEDVTAYGLGEFEINVIAEAIQADGFANVTAAFEAYDAE